MGNHAVPLAKGVLQAIDNSLFGENVAMEVNIGDPAP